MTRRIDPAPPTVPPAAGPFAAVPVRPRCDGWTAERQRNFITALAQSANVEAACRAVGMGTSSAYELRARPGAAAFREAWDIALDYAVHRLAEAALDRAINGVATPIFFQGEQVGERRHYDERLTRFILRLRDPQRFGAWRDDRVPLRHPDEPAMRLTMGLARIDMAAVEAEHGTPVERPPVARGALVTPEQAVALDHDLIDRLAERYAAPGEASEALVSTIMDKLARLEAHRDAERTRAAHDEAARNGTPWGRSEPDLEGGTVCPVSSEQGPRVSS